MWLGHGVSHLSFSSNRSLSCLVESLKEWDTGQGSFSGGSGRISCIERPTSQDSAVVDQEQV